MKHYIKMEKTLIDTSHNCLRFKKVGIWLNSFTNDFHKEIHSEVILVTCIHDPYKISKKEAWKTIKTKASKARDVITSSIQNVNYILEVVETHQKPPENTKEKPPKETKEEPPKETKEEPPKETKEELPKETKEELPKETKEKPPKETKEEPPRKENPRLEDYPHVHFVVAFSSPDGQFPDENKIRGALLEVFDDPDVRHKNYKGKKKKGNTQEFNSHAKILGYVLKNNRHKSTYEHLNNTYPVTLYNISQTVEVHNFFHKLLTDNRKTVFINNVEAPQEPVTLQTQQPKSHHDKPQVFQPEEKNTLNKAIKYVSNWMITNHVYQCYPHIYKLKEGSKNTYLPYKDVNELWHEILTLENNMLLFRYKTNIKESIESKSQNFFPKLTMNHEWIEYKDFYFHIPTKMATTEHPDEPCFCYFDNISLDETHRLPQTFIRVLQNSGFLDDNAKPIGDGVKLIKALYSLLLDRTRKTGTIVLWGESNAGKSVIFVIFERIYPKQVIIRFTKANGFFSKNMEGAQIALADEYDPHELGWTEEQILKFGEGMTTVLLNQKHAEMREHTVTERMMVSGNNIDWMKDSHGNIKPEYENRYFPYFFKSLPKTTIKVGAFDIIRNHESGLVVLWLASKLSEKLQLSTLQEIHEKRQEILKQKEYDDLISMCDDENLIEKPLGLFA